MGLETLTRDDFAPLVGTTLRMESPGGSPVELVLVEATEEGPARAGAPSGLPPRAPFSLLFLGPKVPVFSQRIYPVEHPTLGWLELFLVPIGPDPSGGIRYQAIFS